MERVKSRISIASLVLVLGVLVSLGILFFSADNASSNQDISFIQKAGEGLIAPACGSSAAGYPSVTCSGSNPLVTIGWIGDNFLKGCYDVDVRITPGMSDVETPDVLCYSPGNTGTFTWNGASNNSSYLYSVWLQDEGDGTGSYNHEITSGSFTTPNCAPPPTSDIKANGSDGPISVAYNTSATISWTSSNATSCSVSPTGWTGTSGAQSTGNLTSGQTYSLSCSGSGGSASDSVTVGVTGSALSASCSVSPTSILTGQSATWTASPSGGIGSYSYSWSGTDGLSGTSQSVSKTYTSSGTKSGSVTVTSGSQTVSPSCSNSVSVSEQTLSVSLTANPSSGTAPLNGVDLTASVSGTAFGTINYKFDCTNDGTYEYVFNNISDNPKTVIDACNYSSAGTYTARVLVERGFAPSAQGTTAITVSAPVPPPDYSLTADPPSIFATITGSSPVTSTKSKIRVTPLNGFNSAVSLAVGGISPTLAGAAYNFSDTVLTSSEYSTGSDFSVTVPANTAPTLYNLTVQGTGGGLPPRSVNVALNVKIRDPDFREVFRTFLGPWAQIETPISFPLASLLPAL